MTYRVSFDTAPELAHLRPLARARLPQLPPEELYAVQALRAWRCSNNLTFDATAARLGVEVSTVKRYLSTGPRHTTIPARVLVRAGLLGERRVA
jgi:hypothetical protein